MAQITRTFSLEKITKGAVRYTEVDGQGQLITNTVEGTIGSIYVRKTAFPGGEDNIPMMLTIEITYDYK